MKFLYFFRVFSDRALSIQTPEWFQAKAHEVGKSEDQLSTHPNSSNAAATYRFSDRRVLKTGSRAGTRLSPRVKTSFQIDIDAPSGLGSATFTEWKRRRFMGKFPWLPLPRADLMRSRDGTRVQETANTTLFQPGREFHTFKILPLNGSSSIVEFQEKRDRIFFLTQINN